MGLFDGIGKSMAKAFRALSNWISKDLVGWFESIFTSSHEKAVQHLKAEVAINSINPDMFNDPELKAKVKELKEKWSHSPESISDIAEDLLMLISGWASRVAFENISGVEVSKTHTPTLNSLFNTVAVLTDLCALTEVLGIIGSVLPFDILGGIGEELRAYLDYSGLTQYVGYGLGMILANALNEKIAHELNTQLKHSIIPPEQAVKLKWRGLIDDNTYKSIMYKHGFNDGMITKLEQAMLYYPSPSDLVRFAVREVYTPSIVSQYGLMEDLPQQFLTEAQKSGLSEEAARAFWAAHWELPSITQAFEMLHRGVITQNELMTLLRTQDVMPYWRDKLIAISYNPYTRVDARRMYELGVLSEQELKRAYMDLGYDNQHADKLTLWTKLYVKLPDLLKRYKNGWINTAELRTELSNIGLSTAQIEEIVQTVVKNKQTERIAKERDLTKSEIVKGYKKGVLSFDEAANLLVNMGYDDWEAEYILLINTEFTSSPDTYSEYANAINIIRKARGEPELKVNEQIRKLDEEIKKLTVEYNKLKQANKVKEAERVNTQIKSLREMRAKIVKELNN